MASDYKDILNVPDIWIKKPNYIDNLEREFDYNREIYTYPGTVMSVYSYLNYIDDMITATWVNANKQEEYNLVDFFCNRYGMKSKFWLPIYKNIYVLNTDIAENDTEIIINDIYLADIYKGYERFFIELYNGDIITRHIINVVDNGNGTETLTVNTPMDRNILTSEVMYFGRFIMTKFNSDNLNLKYYNTLTSSVTMTFRELTTAYYNIEELS